MTEMIMAPHKLRDLREWGTFGMSAIVLLVLPIGLGILHNQRLEIEKMVSEGYVSKATLVEEKARADKTHEDIYRTIAKFEVKLDEVLYKQVRTEDSISSLKEAVQMLKH